MMKMVIKESGKPLVIDADAINLLSNVELYSMLKELQKQEFSKRSIIFTPHPLELARICHCNKEKIMKDGILLASDLALDLEAVVIKKDANTVITDGNMFALNRNGNSGMATAGSGDVLCGITAALLAQGLPPLETAVISVYLHALAGDFAAKESNEYSLIASDIVNGISKVMN